MPALRLFKRGEIATLAQLYRIGIIKRVLQKSISALFGLGIVSILGVYFYQEHFSVQAVLKKNPELAQKIQEKHIQFPKITSTPQEIKQITVTEAKVTKFTPDYTLEVLIDNETYTVKLIGIKTPTVEQSMQYKKCFDEDPDVQTHKDLAGKTLFLIADNTFPDKKDSKEISRYALSDDANFLNRNLLEKGLAQLDTSLFYTTLYTKELYADQKIAQENMRGIWTTTCIPTVTITPTMIPTHTPTPKPSAASIRTRSIQTTTSLKNLSITPAPSHKLTSTLIPTRMTTQNPDLQITIITPQISPKNSLNADLILLLINVHRKGKNLEPFEKEDQLCKLASVRAPELYDEIFISGKIHKGFYDRQLPYWITENMAHYESEEHIVKWWLGSSIHRNAIEGKYKYSCGACSGNSCAQLFTNYTPK